MTTLLNKPTIPEIIPFLRDYLADNPVGGSLHVVLDDGNIDNASIKYCIEYAKEQGDERGVVLGEVLLKMSKTQRSKITGTIYGQIINEVRYLWK